MKNKFLNAIFNIAKKSKAQEKDTFKDERDGKIYKTIKIGNQTWMAENLAYKASSGCWAYDNHRISVKIYGYLYDWETANQICPKGWHLPSDNEWRTLIDYLGGLDKAGGKLKSTIVWSSPNREGTNCSGFSALPGGYRDRIHHWYISEGREGHWWSVTGLNATAPWTCVMYYDNPKAFLGYENENEGFSIRCLKD